MLNVAKTYFERDIPLSQLYGACLAFDDTSAPGRLYNGILNDHANDIRHGTGMDLEQLLGELRQQSASCAASILALSEEVREELLRAYENKTDKPSGRSTYETHVLNFRDRVQRDPTAAEDRLLQKLTQERAVYMAMEECIELMLGQ